MVCLPLVFTASLHGHALGFSQTGPRCHHDADNPTSRLEWNLKRSRSNCRLPASNATLDCNACQLLNLRDMLKLGSLNRPAKVPPRPHGRYPLSRSGTLIIQQRARNRPGLCVWVPHPTLGSPLKLSGPSMAPCVCAKAWALRLPLPSK